MPGSRLYYLDSIRGIAALMVAASHFIERTPLHELMFWKYLNFGQVGVVAFFLLSGMVIPYSLKIGHRSIANFWISRFFRLYPAYWFSILLAVLITALVHDRPVDSITVLANLTMFQSLFGFPDMFGVYWTLIIEMFFYIGCTILFVLGILDRTNVRFLVAILFLLFAVMAAFVRFQIERKIPVGVPLCLSIMLFGSIWRDVSLGMGDERTRTFSTAWLAVFFVCLGPICFLAYNKDMGHGENAVSYIVSFTTGLVFCLLMTTRFKLAPRLLVYLGTISYSVYLVHPFFLEIVARRIDMASRFDTFAFFLYIAATILLASLSCFLIEKPSTRLGRLFRKRLSPASSLLETRKSEV